MINRKTSGNGTIGKRLGEKTGKGTPLSVRMRRRTPGLSRGKIPENSIIEITREVISQQKKNSQKKGSRG